MLINRYVHKQCGFLAQEQCKYRIKDNYIRFYLKYIQPKKSLISQGLYQDLHLDELPEWQSMMGLQFENLVLNNLGSIQKKLQISPVSVLSAAPYFQNKTLRKEACQIDLLIQTKHTVYVCEVKFRKQISLNVIDEVQEKIRKIKVPKTTSVRPVIIYEGELSSRVQNENFFSHLISFKKLLC